APRRLERFVRNTAGVAYVDPLDCIMGSLAWPCIFRSTLKAFQVGPSYTFVSSPHPFGQISRCGGLISQELLERSCAVVPQGSSSEVSADDHSLQELIVQKRKKWQADKRAKRNNRIQGLWMWMFG